MSDVYRKTSEELWLEERRWYAGIAGFGYDGSTGFDRPGPTRFPDIYRPGPHNMTVVGEGRRGPTGYRTVEVVCDTCVRLPSRWVAVDAVGRRVDAHQGEMGRRGLLERETDESA